MKRNRVVVSAAAPALTRVEPGLLGDAYHRLLSAGWPTAVVVLAGAFFATNLAFACAYLALGDAIAGARAGSLVDAFFFSVQTMATIGYGVMAPRTFAANALVCVEAVVGLLGFAIVTGLMFARFARPTARVLFSRVAVVAPRDGVPSLMFRMANARGNGIVEAEVHVVLARDERTVEGERVRRFYDLSLTRTRNVLFALSWTVVHQIRPGSPLEGATTTTLGEDDVAIIVSVVGLDETSAQTIHARHVYAAEHIVWNARFADILSWQGRNRELSYDRFHEVVHLKG
jgi:inward rectifier potassium channel